MGVLSKMKDIFGRGGYEVHSPGTFKTGRRDSSKAEQLHNGETSQQIADRMARGSDEDERHARQHARNSGNYSK